MPGSPSYDSCDLIGLTVRCKGEQTVTATGRGSEDYRSSRRREGDDSPSPNGIVGLLAGQHSGALASFGSYLLAAIGTAAFQWRRVNSSVTGIGG